MLVGLSGGSDSVALTLLLRELAPTMRFEVAGAAHLHHQLRETADRDEAFCRNLAERVGLEFRTVRSDVRAAAARDGLSLEDAARRARYEFLDRAASELGASRIAVGHTLDDQAETFLLKLARGAGPAGLGGIYLSKGRVVRPLLEVSRADLREYLTAGGQPWVDDETNADVGNPRNCVRHEVLPHLEAALALPVRRAIARAAVLLGEDAVWLDAMAAEILAAVSGSGPDGLELDAERLRATPLPLTRRILFQALRSRANGREVGLDHVQSALDVLTGLSGGSDLPGSRVELRGKKLVLIQ
ncbi:MAG TPA: tRNA lysidine(34) synthetase TilS [Pyrinomonadaceae bacterium]